MLNVPQFKMVVPNQNQSPNARNTNNAIMKEQIRKACTSHYNASNAAAAAEVHINIRKMNVNGVNAGFQNRLAEIHL
jgi:hypothetical protein